MEIKMVVTPEHMSASMLDETGRHLSVASVDWHSWEGRWWVSRVSVKPESQRGKGVGRRLVEALQEEATKMGRPCMLVAPGGYGSDPQSLQKFYGSLGFKPLEGGQCMLWHGEH